MLFSRQLPLSSLIVLCRSLRHNLSAGLTLRHVFRQQARKGPVAVRPIAGRIAEQLEAGESLADALGEDKAAFPPLFLALTEVGEESGNLPEVLAKLEEYLVLQQRLQRQLVAQITWPVIQFFAAIFVIAGMLFLLGILSPAGGQGFDPLGFGLTGTSGALAWLSFWAVLLSGLAVVYFVLTRTLKHQAAVDELLLRLPIIGPCLHALCLARFCLALQVTLETGMPIANALRLSLRGTGNAAYAARVPVVVESIRSGDELTAALREANLFPDDFLLILETGEEGGRVSEVLGHQCEYYQEESGRRLTLLSQAASWGVWLVVAGMIAFLIFRIFLTYISMITSLTP